MDSKMVDFVEELLRVRKTVLTVAYLYITIGCAFILAALIKSISCYYKVCYKKVLHNHLECFKKEPGDSILTFCFSNMLSAFQLKSF